MTTRNPIAISAGHSAKCRGASGIIDEYDENCRVVTKVAEVLRAAGVTCHGPFIDTVSTSQNENLNRIVDWHNSKDRQLDVSIHFNCYDGSAHGTEALYVTQDDLAADVARAVAGAGGFTNRGPKRRTDLAFLNGTDEPAILIEVCFCDSHQDCDLYEENFDAICETIAETISGRAVQPGPDPIPPPEPTDVPVVTVTVNPPGSAKVVVVGAANIASEI